MQHNIFRTNNYHFMICKPQMAGLSVSFMAPSWHGIDPRNILCSYHHKTQHEPQASKRYYPCSADSMVEFKPSNALACMLQADRPLPTLVLVEEALVTPWSIWGTNQNPRFIFSYTFSLAGILGDWYLPSNIWNLYIQVFLMWQGTCTGRRELYTILTQV